MHIIYYVLHATAESTKHTHMHMHAWIHSQSILSLMVCNYSRTMHACMMEVSPTSGTTDSGLSAGLFVAGLSSVIAITLLVDGIIWGACKLSQRK